MYAARMSTIVFGAIVLFAIYAMAHFIHEWWEWRRSNDDTPEDT